MKKIIKLLGDLRRVATLQNRMTARRTKLLVVGIKIAQLDFESALAHDAVKLNFSFEKHIVIQGRNTVTTQANFLLVDRLTDRLNNQILILRVKIQTTNGGGEIFVRLDMYGNMAKQLRTLGGAEEILFLITAKYLFIHLAHIIQVEVEKELKISQNSAEFIQVQFKISRYTKSVKVLYVEDEKYLAEAVIHLLRQAKIEVDWASDGVQGLECAVREDYDCIVLDIMLPEVSGIEILQTVRQRKIATPVIMLSALTEVEDKIKTLDIGADDYLAKPFKTAELIARLKALVRRPPLQLEQTLSFGDLVYDYQTCTVNGMELTAKESKLLELFLRQPQQLLAKERLLTYVWGQEELTENYVEVYISRLRNKLRKVGSKVKIVAVRNLGYKLVDEGEHVS